MRIQLSSLFTLAFCFALSFAFAQGDEIPFGDLPPTNEYGKCFAKCKVPDVYETVSVQKVKKEASTKLEKVPAVYETVTEQVLVKEGYTKYKTIPATFKTVTDQIQIEPEKRILKTIPARYETKTRQILVTPERGQWVRKRKSPNCFSQNPDDCYVACYEKIPAKYRTEKYQVLTDTNGDGIGDGPRTTENVKPAKFKTVTKRVIDQPARVEEVPVAAQYKTVTKKVLVSPEATTEVVIPAVYQDIKEKRLVSKGGYTIWTEILCAERTTNSKVRKVQEALASKGYNPGTADGIMGLKTQTALKQFQTDKGLPIGNLNLETLKALGISQ